MNIILPNLGKIQYEVKTPTTIKDVKEYFARQKILFGDNAFLLEFKGETQFSEFSLPERYKKSKGDEVTLYGLN